MEAAATQQHLPIAGIQDAVVILNDGSVRAVIRVNPVNFQLKSETEQSAIIAGFQSFLNGLDFPIQLVVQSKLLDLTPYLTRMRDRIANVPNKLLRLAGQEYATYLEKSISVANMMSKRFYVVVTYSTISGNVGAQGIKGFFSKSTEGPVITQAQFEQSRNEVLNRALQVMNGLKRASVTGSVLSTEELLELYYGAYNPDIAREEKLGSLDAIGVSQGL